MALNFFGIQKLTLIDFPSHLAATVFTPGCNLRCPYCQNPELIEGSFRSGMLNRKQLYTFLQKRRNVLEGICISGGEPLIHPNLGELIDTMHKLGYKVKLDTNGTLPERLKYLKVDYVAMDIKTSPGKYSALGYDDKNIGDKLVQSVEDIKSRGILYEFRTTLVPRIVTPEDFDVIIPLLKGAQRYYLTQFRTGHTLDPEFREEEPYDEEIFQSIQKRVEEAGIPCRIRMENPGA